MTKVEGRMSNGRFAGIRLLEVAPRMSRRRLALIVSVALLCGLPPDPRPAVSADDQKKPAAKGPEAKPEPKKEQRADGDAAQKAPPATPPANPPPRNPIVDFIKRGFNPGKAQGANPKAATQPGDAPTDGAPPRNPERNISDPTAPYDRNATGWMVRANAHARANEWKQALELLQRVSDQPEDSLVKGESGQWVSIHAEADRRRGAAPPEVLAEYRAEYEGLARQLLSEAMRSGTPAGFGKVARGYFHTDAGHEAADRLGSMHLNRGEFGLAAYWFSALWQAKPKLTQNPLWRTKAAYAFKQAGQSALAGELAGGPGAGSVSVTVGGKPRELAKWLNEVPLIGSRAEAPLKEWLTFLGILV